MAREPTDSVSSVLLMLATAGARSTVLSYVAGTKEIKTQAQTAALRIGCAQLC
jgi:hypothetical protein